MTQANGARNFDPPNLTSDPTPLTTQQILREIGSLRELIEARLDAMDRATALFEANLSRMPTDTDKQIGHLKELHGERFEGIEKQFRERDTRVEGTARDSKLAIDAALNAAKEAVAKSEGSTKEQISQIGTLIQSETRASNDKIAAIQSRLDRTEGRGGGYAGAWGYAVGALGVVATIVGLLAYVAKN